MYIKLDDLSLKNLRELLKRVPLKGDEAIEYVKIIEAIEHPIEIPLPKKEESKEE